MYHHADRFNHPLGVRVLEGVATDGGTGGTSGEGSLHHLQQLLVGLHLLAAGDDHRHRATGHHLPEAIGRAGVVHLDDVGAELRAHSGGVLDVLDIVFALDLLSAGVHHRHQGHTPGHAALRDLTEATEHLRIRWRAEVYVDGDRVRPQLDRFLHRTHLDLRVGVGTKRGAGGKMDDQADVSAAAAVARRHHALVHEDSVRAAVHHLRHGALHVL